MPVPLFLRLLGAGENRSPALRIDSTDVGVGRLVRRRQAIADPELGHQNARPVGVGLDLLTQLADHDAQIVRVVDVGQAPDLLQQRYSFGVSVRRSSSMKTLRAARSIFSRSIRTMLSPVVARVLRRSTTLERASSSAMPNGLVT